MSVGSQTLNCHLRRRGDRSSSPKACGACISWSRAPEVCLHPVEGGSTKLLDAQACACMGTGSTGHEDAVAAQ